MPNRFDAFTEDELNVMWDGMYDVRENFRRMNEHGVFDEAIKAITDMFSEMYASRNFGREARRDV